MEDELKKALQNVSDSYEDFVTGSLLDVKGNEAYQEKLLQYLKDNPDAQTDDVIEYIFDEVISKEK